MRFSTISNSVMLGLNVALNIYEVISRRCLHVCNSAILTIGTAVKSKCQAGILTVYYSSASNPSQNET